ncbi:MAG: c-type cytochrome [Caulobacterales bacterium]
MTFDPTPRRRRLAAAAAVTAAALATAALAHPPVPAGTAAQAPAAAQVPAPAAATTAPPAEFAICAACHESTANARASLGPNLFNVGGRKAGAVTDYDYSPAMKASGITWTADTLQAFVLDPAKTVPGNKMDYPGAGDAASAKAIADYLLTLKG